MKTLLLFGAGKSATVLIDYLITETGKNNWKFIIADANGEAIIAKTNNSPLAEAVQVDITNNEERSNLIQKANVVISLMPPTLHFLIAKDCVKYQKNLLTASYVDDNIKSLEAEITNKKLFFLCEMGLDPGIDHMSAMRIIDKIQNEGGVITSFKSHCGGLVAPENDDNPWHYKISWNPRNVVLAGSSGAEYKLNGEIKKVAYKNLFSDPNRVVVDNLELAYYPNRDSLSYIKTYQLHHATTFLRTTLRYPAFLNGWSAIVNAELTDDKTPVITKNLTFAKWSADILSYINDDNKILLDYLGLFDENPVPSTAKTSADILQYLIESKLAMMPTDKDMVVMLHEFEYTINTTPKKIKSSLIVKGENSIKTAMAKTVGLPLGIAAKLILNNTIKISGLHIPIKKAIYDPVLNELEKLNIRFCESII